MSRGFLSGQRFERKRESGVSLIELVIFIVVFSILGSGILIAFVISLEKTPNIERLSHLLGLARDRMEIILTQREAKGFASFTDICEDNPEPAVCAIPTDYGIYNFSAQPVSSAIVTDTNNADVKHISIFVEDITNPVLEAEVVNY